MATTTSAHLVYDIITRVMEIGRDSNEYDLLFNCSLVNWEFNRAASRMLYSLVVLSPPFVGTVLDLKDIGSIPKSSNFDSACLPRNTLYVTALKISGYISERPPPRNTLPDRIANALSSFVNLQKIDLTPSRYYEKTFDRTIPLLCGLPHLTEVSVNASCTDDAHASLLVNVGHGRLTKLTLVNPGRKILQLLPDWLANLSGTLIELHLKENCGSVTPGVLRSFLSHVEDTLQGFSLGLSYSLTNQDVFDFLSHLKALRSLNLRYYWAQQQMKPPVRQPKLTSLCSFTVTHPPMFTRFEVDAFDKWVRWVIAGSPNLEELRLKYEDSGMPMADTHLSHDALVDHLVRKHSMSLKYLDFESAFVRVNKLSVMLEACTQLMALSLQVAQSSLDLLVDRQSTLPFLQSLSLQVCNAPKRFRVDESMVATVMKNHRPCLRQICINGIIWKVSWTMNEGQKNSWIVKKTDNPLPPWYRKTKK